MKNKHPFLLPRPDGASAICVRLVTTLCPKSRLENIPQIPLSALPEAVPVPHISAHAVLLLSFPLLGVDAVVGGAAVLLAGAQALRGGHGIVLWAQDRL